MVDRSPGFFDLDDRLAELSAKGDSLERVQALVDFEMFRVALEAAVPRAGRQAGLRSRADVQSADPSGDACAVGRAHGVPDQRPAVLYALPRARIGRYRSRRQHDLDVPRGAEEGRRH
jgi:hypothetical protein